MVQELLGSTGGTFKNPPTNYYQNETDTLKVAENVAQVFMGMRVQCAQCHNHPFDRWTQNDYYGFAAFFSQVGRKGTDDPREIVVFNSGGGEVTHPVGGRVMKPKFLGGATPDVAGKDRRVVLAKWLASSDNPYFATNLANIVWDHFFGQGIINPVDDVRVSNPASNPELLRELGKRFTEYHYDFKKLIRDICNSRTYQLCTQPNESNQSDTRSFSHAALRRIKAETFLDCISQVTETKNKFPGLPLAPCRPDRGRHGKHLFSEHLRPSHEGDGVFLRGQARADPVAVITPLERRSHDSANCRRQPRRPATWGEKAAEGDRRRAIHPLSESQAARDRGREARAGGRQGARQEEGAGRRLLGVVELTRVYVQPLEV